MDYTIYFTDPAKAPFTIKPYTANGPASPEQSTPLYPTAVSANTSLILLGKGHADYGEPFQRDFVHMLEHFAGPVEPAYAIQGQLWFKNDTSELRLKTNATGPNVWNAVVLNGALTTDLNVNGHKIINLGTATLATDALSLGQANSLYLPLTGGSLSGNLVMTGTTHITLPNTPVNLTDAANKNYVDTQITSLIALASADFVAKVGDTMTGTLLITGGGINITGGSLTVGAGVTINGGGSVVNNIGTPVIASDAATKGYVDSLSTLYLPKTGGTLTGTLTISVGGLGITGGNLVLSPGVGFNAGGTILNNVGSPTFSTDAATKGYVDAAIAAAPGDGVLTSGSFNISTGVLTLNNTGGTTPSVTIPGFVSIPLSDTNVTVNANPTNIVSRLRELSVDLPSYPTITLDQAMNFFDADMYQLYLRNARYIVQHLQHTITGVVTGLNGTFTVALGNYMEQLNPGATIVVAGSGAGNGTYTILSSSYENILTFGTLVPGSGYANGTYSNVQLYGGAGALATATITVAGGAVTSVVLGSGGFGYAVGDILSSPLSGIGTGFSIKVASINSTTATFTVTGTIPGGATTGGTLEPQSYFMPFVYIVEHNALNVHLNGIKQMASERAEYEVTYPATTLNIASDTGLTVGTYSAHITVDGSPVSTIAVANVVTTPFTFDKLMDALNAPFLAYPITAVVTGASGSFTVVGDVTNYFQPGIAFTVATNSFAAANGNYTVASRSFVAGSTTIVVTGTVPVGTTATGTMTLTNGATTVFENMPSIQRNFTFSTNATDAILSIYSDTTGVGSSIVITDVNLFSTLRGLGGLPPEVDTFAPVVDLSYKELGDINTFSDMIMFNALPAPNSMLEFTITK